MNAIGVVKSTVYERGETNRNTLFHHVFNRGTSVCARCPQSLIESQRHWQLDVTFGEDCARIILSAKRFIEWIGVKEVKDNDFEIYKLLSEQVLKDYSYEPIDSNAMEVTPPYKSIYEIYKSRMKTDAEIRGRIVWEKKNEAGEWVLCQRKERERAVLVIPNVQLQLQIKHLKEISGMDIYNWSKAKWAQQGWLLKNDKEYTFKDKYKIDITRPRDSKNRETHYCIVLYED